MTSLLTIALSALLLLAAANNVVAQPVYRIDDLGVLPGTNESAANAINADGVVVGQARPSAGFFQAVLWPSDAAVPTSVAALIGEDSSVANGINDAGRFTTVAGFASAGQIIGATAHFWDGATLIDLGKLGSGTPQSALSSIGHAVNNEDQVVGRAWASDTAAGFFHAFSWSNGVMTDLGTIAPCMESEALDINDSGEMVGAASAGGCQPNVALIWPSAGEPPVSINTLLAAAGIAANVVRATGINDDGVVLAQRVASGKGRCVIITRTPVVALVNVGAIGPDAEFLTTCAPGKINNRGEAVASQVAGGGISIALLYASGELYDLNALLEPQSDAAWELLTAVDINDGGTIVGQGRINGELHAYRAVRTGGGSSCLGDCDLSGEVLVDELITMVNVALGTTSVSLCDAGDQDGSGQITVDELIGAIDKALNGCS